MKTIDWAPGTDTGRQRQDNQDRFIANKGWTEGQALLVVIDGVGGYEGGDIAAGIAKESIEYYMSTPKGDALSMLKEAVILANNQIIEKKETDPKLAQMCCVLTAVVADSKKQVLQYVHVGDTRLYRFRHGTLEKITNDHSLVGVREDAGELSEEEAMHHPRRNVILRQAGTEVHRIDDPDFLEYGETEFQSGDILLICSDGLSDLITKEQIIASLNKKQPLAASVTELIASANKAGGTDNITVVLAKNLSKVKPLQQIETVAGPVPAMEEKETITFPEKEDAVIKNRTKPANRLTTILLIAILVSILTLAGIWLVKTPAAPKSKAITAQVDSNHAVIKKIPDSLLNLDPDTIRLKNTIELNKTGLVTGSKIKTTVLVPGVAFDSGIAIKIVNIPGNQTTDTIWLKDLIIQGFETGISVERNSILYLDNVLFKNVAHPVSYRNGDSAKLKNLRFE